VAVSSKALDLSMVEITNPSSTPEMKGCHQGKEDCLRMANGQHTGIKFGVV